MADQAQYVSLDDANSRAAAVNEPQGFIERYRGTSGLVIDEIQRVPELLIPIKREVDLDRSPGKFILTGSSNVMSIPSVSEALAGRVEILTLWPLAQSELIGKRSDFLQHAYAPTFPTFELIEQPLQLSSGRYAAVTQNPSAARAPIGETHGSVTMSPQLFSAR